MDESISSLDKRIDLMRQHMDGMTQVVPWARETGFKVTRVERGQVWGVQPFAEHLVGDVEAQVIHGGAITTLLDNLSGMACAAAILSGSSGQVSGCSLSHTFRIGDDVGLQSANSQAPDPFDAAYTTPHGSTSFNGCD